MQMFLPKLHIQNATSPTCTVPKLMQSEKSIRRRVCRVDIGLQDKP